MSSSLLMDCPVYIVCGKIDDSSLSSSMLPVSDSSSARLKDFTVMALAKDSTRYLRIES